MEITSILKALLTEMRNISSSETVIGAPIQVGDSTIVPVNRLGRRFFPFSETPPGGCESWPRWWESPPSLEGEALRSAAEARASADRSR